MMQRITHIETHPDLTIDFTFNDGKKKHIDFKPFIGTDKLSAALKDYAYFQQVRLYENGRGIYWPNEFDFCPDYLHDFA